MSTDTRSQRPDTRQKPDFVGPDGGNNTFLGFTLASAGIADNSPVAECQNNANFPNFFGTSAAAPHVASIAALLLQADPALTPAEIYTVLQQSAKPIGATPTAAAPNFAAGYGFVQADVAASNIPAIVPAAPTLSASRDLYRREHIDHHHLVFREHHRLHGFRQLERSAGK